MASFVRFPLPHKTQPSISEISGFFSELPLWTSVPPDSCTLPAPQSPHMIEECSEQEAEALIPVVESVIAVLRTKDAIEIG